MEAKFVVPVFREKWTPEAVSGLIGQFFPAKELDIVVGEGTVLNAELDDMGNLLLTVEWPSDRFAVLSMDDLSSISIGENNAKG